MTVAEQIKEVKEKIVKLQNVAAHIADLKDQRSELLSEVAQLERSVDKELADVMKLENVSLKSIIHKIAGNKEEVIEKERQEYLETVLNLKKARESLDILEYEISVLEGKESVRIYIDQLEVLKEKRKDEILREPGETRDLIIRLLHDQDDIASMELEIKEAHNELVIYRDQLTKILTSLSHANYWYQIENNTGNRRAYHNRLEAIDRAIYEGSRSAVTLRKLKNELRDISISYDPKPMNRLNQLQKGMSGNFIRNIVGDIMFHQNLNISYGEVQAVLSNSKYLTNTLSDLHSELKEKENRITERINKILIS